MQLSLSSLIKIISSIPIISILILVSLVFSTPIVAYSQLSFIVTNHQQQHAFPITQVVSITKDKSKTTEVMELNNSLQKVPIILVPLLLLLYYRAISIRPLVTPLRMGVTTKW
jgi:hypothetical protein